MHLMGLGPACVPARIVLETADLPRARAFYEALVGWSFTEDPAGGVRARTRDGREVAVLRPDGPGRAQWTVYFATTDLGGVERRARARGADVQRGGLSADAVIITDESGIRFGVFEEPDVSWTPGPGDITLADLGCWDLSAALEFHLNVLGLEAVRLRAPDELYRAYALIGAEQCVAIAWDMGWHYPTSFPPRWMPSLGVASTDVAAAMAVELGGRVQWPPTDGPLSRFTLVEDPGGAWIGLMPPIARSTQDVRREGGTAPTG